LNGILYGTLGDSYDFGFRIDDRSPPMKKLEGLFVLHKNTRSSENLQGGLMNVIELTSGRDIELQSSSMSFPTFEVALHGSFVLCGVIPAIHLSFWVLRKISLGSRVIRTCFG